MNPHPLLRAMRGLFVASIAAMCVLTFVWPLAVSADPAHPGFRIAAIAAFVAFFVSLTVLLAARLTQRP